MAPIRRDLDLSANGSRFRFTRNVGNFVLDVAGIENLQTRALGGADLINVNNLSGTDVLGVSLDLSGTIGSGVGDGQADTVNVAATEGADAVTVTGSSGSVSVTGLSATVTVIGSEAANDQMIVTTLGGADFVDASGLAAAVIGFTVDGGDDDDVITGSAGDDTLLGGLGRRRAERRPGVRYAGRWSGQQYPHSVERASGT